MLPQRTLIRGYPLSLYILRSVRVVRLWDVFTILRTECNI